jgi:hypothetical protein
MQWFIKSTLKSPAFWQENAELGMSFAVQPKGEVCGIMDGKLVRQCRNKFR